MLRFLCNPHDGISFARVANKPARGMGDALVGRVEAHAERHGIDIIAALAKNDEVRDEQDRPLTDAARKACDEALAVFHMDTGGMTVAEVALEVLDRTGYDKWLKEKYEEKKEYEGRQRNVTELTNAIVDFCNANPKASIADYLQSISLYTGGDSKQDDNAVRLMSLHASKGLEFERRLHDRRRARHPAAREGPEGQRRRRP